MPNSWGRFHPCWGAAWSRARLLLQERQVVDGVVDEVVPLVGTQVAGDDLRSAADDHQVHVAPNDDVPVPVGHRHRVVVGLVPDQ